ncbi:hypothetical protein PIB30_081989, partial [Stylosanthes scabra]|nr:hypothetical protein [Stylosanthes scabra]
KVNASIRSNFVELQEVQRKKMIWSFREGRKEDSRKSKKDILKQKIEDGNEYFVELAEEENEGNLIKEKQLPEQEERCKGWELELASTIRRSLSLKKKRDKKILKLERILKAKKRMQLRMAHKIMQQGARR